MDAREGDATQTTPRLPEKTEDRVLSPLRVELRELKEECMSILFVDAQYWRGASVRFFCLALLDVTLLDDMYGKATQSVKGLLEPKEQREGVVAPRLGREQLVGTSTH